MIFFTISFRSNSLQKKTELNVLMPETGSEPCKVLWALHGMTDDHTGWLRNSNIELLAEKYNIAVVMPNADLSFYVNMAFGADYFDFLSQELPEFVSRYLHISHSRNDNYIIGNSMGGYGAFYTAMHCPNQYSAAISLSGPMRIDWINTVLSDLRLAEAFIEKNKDEQKIVAESFSIEHDIPLPLICSLMEFGGKSMTRVFNAMFGIGSDLKGSGFDIFYLADKLEEENEPIRLIAYCGKQDYHYSSNILFEEYMRSKKLNYKLITGEGSHNWVYWNPSIESVLKDLFLK